jgi:hypothetical protein
MIPESEDKVQLQTFKNLPKLESELMEIQSEIISQRKVFDGLKDDIARRPKANCLLELQEREMIRMTIQLQNELEDIRGSMRTEREVRQRNVEAEMVQESSDAIPVDLRDQKNVLGSCLADLRSNVIKEEQKLSIC